MDSEDRIDIRNRVRQHGARQLVIARMIAPDDWQGELRRALVSDRVSQHFWNGGSDLRLFLESFAIFFTATMMFLI
ncbi:hypothetical protein FHR22_001244 [Sphingopyxis panaciterrae]|uniref:hypothetical protein n=1 Tax=Sphingopyxis panaciterrae TaxID=363841 RepID=UPI001421E5F4|nr:hypothetical protein [Sphingopyxis panaciterrae]NIJ36595.1 hypothetical protein [Sphingopyxis panaciterrae]